MVHLLSVVNSLQRPVCQRVTRQWETFCAALPPVACIYTVSRDSPQMQADWQDNAGVLHQLLSASTVSSSGRTMASGSRNGVSCSGPFLCLIATTASSMPSTLPINCVSRTTQRPYKWFSRQQGNEAEA